MDHARLCLGLAERYEAQARDLRLPDHLAHSWRTCAEAWARLDNSEAEEQFGLQTIRQRPAATSLVRGDIALRRDYEAA